MVKGQNLQLIIAHSLMGLACEIHRVQKVSIDLETQKEFIFSESISPHMYDQQEQIQGNNP